MPAKIIDGKKIAQKISDDLKKKSNKLAVKPGLAVIMVGENPASKVYVNMKEVKCIELGYYSEKYELKENTPEDEIIHLIKRLNNKKEIHGILVQLPLPKHINELKVIEAISPEKDVDGFHPENIGHMFIAQNKIIPATPKGIIRLLEECKIKIEGKHAVVIGRSNIVGKPISILLQQKHATVTMCHSKTKNLKELTKQADILVVAAGKPNLVKKEMVKKGAVVIDVGTNRVGKKLVGDVDFEGVKEIASYITPVPGGIGPMTIAMLMENTYLAAEKIRSFTN